MRRLAAVPLFLVLASLGCGEVVEPTTSYQFLGQPIFGGSAPDDVRYDAVVGIQININYSIYVCSGTLVSSDLVLTAGHCVVVGSRGKTIVVGSPNQFEVSFGDELRLWGTGADVSAVYLHPEYDAKKLGVNDVALLRLQQSAPAGIAPIRWLPSNMADLELVGTPMIMAGFGRTETSGPGDKLWVAGVISDVTEFGLENQQDDHTGTCGGDSGGPLIYDFYGTWYVGGTTSWGDNACTDYGWSMRISAYDAWISSYVGCETDADCSDSECTTGACINGACVDQPVPDDQACSAGICCGGVCAQAACADDADCGSSACGGSCQGSGTCGATCDYTSSDGLGCEDGDACTDPDTCDAGMCQAGPTLDTPECAAPTCLERRARCTSGAECCSGSCLPNGRCQ